jgi:hypothetical protein
LKRSQQRLEQLRTAARNAKQRARTLKGELKAARKLAKQSRKALRKAVVAHQRAAAKTAGKKSLPSKPVNPKRPKGKVVSAAKTVVIKPDVPRVRKARVRKESVPRPVTAAVVPAPVRAAPPSRRKAPQRLRPRPAPALAPTPAPEPATRGVEDSDASVEALLPQSRSGVE